MPHRLDEFRAKIQFVSFAAMPSLIHKAAAKTDCLGPGGRPSNTRYIQIALCRALARDLGLDYAELLTRLPQLTGAAAAPPKRRATSVRERA